MREELDKLICEIIAASQRGNWDGIRKEYADRIEALYKPRPYSLDPNSDNYKVPEVGERVVVCDTGMANEIFDFNWTGKYEDWMVYWLWLPTRTKDDF